MFNNCFKDVHRLLLCFILITWIELLIILLNHSKSQLKINFFDDQTWFVRMHESKHKNALNQTFIFIHKVRQLLKSLFRLFLFNVNIVKVRWFIKDLAFLLYELVIYNRACWSVERPRLIVEFELYYESKIEWLILLSS